jgi:hypothetical protein
MHLPRPLPLALAALALALIAGCGDGDSGEETSSSTSTITGAEALAAYSTEMQDELASFATEFASLGEAAADPSSVRDYADAVSELQARLGETISNLEAITPPSEVADIHQRLIAAFEELRESFAPIVEAVESGDREQAQQAILDLQQANADFQTELADLSAQAQRLGAPLEPSTTTTSP